MKGFTKLAAAASLALACASGAQADNVGVRFTGNNKTINTHLYINDEAVNAYFGSYSIQLSGAQSGSFAAYCVEPTQDVSSLTKTYNRSRLGEFHLPADSSTRFAAVTQLFGQGYAGSQKDGYAASGFQLALWEVWYDNGVLDSGKIKILNTAGKQTDQKMVDEAQRLLDKLTGPAGAAYILTHYANGAFQDYVIASAVPEPESFVLLLAGLGLLAVRRRQQHGETAARITAA